MNGRCSFCKKWLIIFAKKDGKRYCRGCWIDREEREAKAKKEEAAQLDLIFKELKL